MTAQNAAYELLKDGILSGRLPAGSQINPVEVGAQLGISRMPVREALLQLEAEGLVTFGLNRRPVVTTLTPKDILELFEIRIALESLACERASTRMSSADFADLEAQLGRMDRAMPDARKWIELHDAFHDMIYDRAEMPRLSEGIRQIRQTVRPYLLMYIDAYKSFEMPGAEHTGLLNMLRSGSPEQARTAVTEHIRNTAASVVYFLMNQNVGTSAANPNTSQQLEGHKK
ncbi:MAG TPA: GntR family transcriptional regulator [Xanthobacteraceae bacterium]|nr:GntR family transcriptional regulator [Xanthobacteraceae bacterium]